MKFTKDDYMTIRIRGELKQQLSDYAAIHHRSLASQICLIIEDFIKEEKHDATRTDKQNARKSKKAAR